MEEWKIQIDYMSNSFRPVFEEERREIKLDTVNLYVRNVKNSKYKMSTDAISGRDKTVRLTERILREIQEDLPENFEIPEVAVVDFANINKNAIGGYHRDTGIIYINRKYKTRKEIQQFVNRNNGRFANKTEHAPMLHELGHKFYYDTIKNIEHKNNICYNDAKNMIDRKLQEYLDSNCKRTLKNDISEYANRGYVVGEYTEVVAESFSVRKNNKYAEDIIRMLLEMGW